jgi:hypothetical protein
VNFLLSNTKWFWSGMSTASMRDISCEPGRNLGIKYCHRDRVSYRSTEWSCRWSYHISCNFPYCIVLELLYIVQLNSVVLLVWCVYQLWIEPDNMDSACGGILWWRLWIVGVKRNQLDAQFILSIFRQPLHVSGVSRPIIRRYNRMYTTFGTSYSF